MSACMSVSREGEVSMSAPRGCEFVQVNFPFKELSHLDYVRLTLKDGTAVYVNPLKPSPQKKGGTSESPHIQFHIFCQFKALVVNSKKVPATCSHLANLVPTTDTQNLNDIATKDFKLVLVKQVNLKAVQANQFKGFLSWNGNKDYREEVAFEKIEVAFEKGVSGGNSNEEKAS